VTPVKWKKLIAPIIITILILIYLFFYVFYLSREPMPPIFKFFVVAIPLGFMGVSVYVLYERIKEIRSGEEDDLSKY
jgi:hypothetical protein